MKVTVSKGNEKSYLVDLANQIKLIMYWEIVRSAPIIHKQNSYIVINSIYQTIYRSEFIPFFFVLLKRNIFSNLFIDFFPYQKKKHIFKFRSKNEERVNEMLSIGLVHKDMLRHENILRMIFSSDLNFLTRHGSLNSDSTIVGDYLFESLQNSYSNSQYNRSRCDCRPKPYVWIKLMLEPYILCSIFSFPFMPCYIFPSL